MIDFKRMTDEELLRSTDQHVAKEKEATILTTRHFQEVMNRKAYLPDFTSLFDFLTKKHGYCAGSASIRISTLKLIKEVPAVQAKIECGDISMSVASNIQSFLASEAKIKRPYSANAKVELIETCVGLSVSEVKKEFVRRNPEIEKRDVVRPVSVDRTRLEISISTHGLAKLNQLRDLFAHANSTMSLGELIERLAGEGLEKHCPKRKAARAKARRAKFAQRKRDDSPLGSVSSESKRESSLGNAELESASAEVHPYEVPLSPKPRSRYISAKERHDVANDDAGCTFVDSKGQRCGSRKFLQLDHVIAFSMGGAHEAVNLRWMCAAHNQWRARDPQWRESTQMRA